MSKYLPVTIHTEKGPMTAVIKIESGGGGGNVGTFLQAGTGAVSRTYQDKMREIVSAKDFGAVGDGVADDTAAVQAAVDYLSSVGGGTLLLSRGTYKFTSMLQIVDKGVRILGEGIEATIINPPGDMPGFFFNLAGASRGEWGVEHLTIRYVTDHLAAMAIVVMGGVHGTISHAYIERANTGVMLIDCTATHISHLVCISCGTQCVQLGGQTNNVFISDCYFDGSIFGTSTPAANSHGLEIQQNVHGVAATNVKIVACNSPLHAVGSVPDFPNSLVFTSCQFKDSTYAVALGVVKNIKFVGCEFSNIGVGAYINTCYQTSFIGCSFTNNRAAGCEMSYPCEGVLFNGCTFDSNGQDASNTHPGLKVNEYVSDWTVLGCNFGNFGDFPATQKHGISVASGPSDRYIIKDCNFGAHTDSPVSNLGTGTERYIGANVGYRTSNSGTATINSGNTTTVVNHGLAVTPEIHEIFVAPADAGADPSSLYVSTITATQFTINIAAAPASDVNLIWQARADGA